MTKKNSKKYADPVTGNYVEPVTDAPYDKSSEVVLPKAVEESIARPVDPVDEANEAINKDYPWAVPSMTSPQRAILCELYRIRKALDAKYIITKKSLDAKYIITKKSLEGLEKYYDLDNQETKKC